MSLCFKKKFNMLVCKSCVAMESINHISHLLLVLKKLMPKTGDPTHSILSYGSHSKVVGKTVHVLTQMESAGSNAIARTW